MVKNSIMFSAACWGTQLVGTLGIHEFPLGGFPYISVFFNL
jgi:hypothetical protein